jgi:hypothetical protein
MRGDARHGARHAFFKRHLAVAQKVAKERGQ